MYEEVSSLGLEKFKSDIENRSSSGNYDYSGNASVSADYYDYYFGVDAGNASIYINTDDVPELKDTDLQDIICKNYFYKQNCTANMASEASNATSDGLHCPSVFDTLCWPAAMPDSVVEIPCFPTFAWMEGGSGYRYCQANGQWYSEYNDQLAGYYPKSYVDECSIKSDTIQSTGEEIFLDIPRIIYTCGNSVSLLCLLLAIAIFAALKSLHCVRNYIHMNLMISFMFRYSFALIGDAIVDGDSSTSNTHERYVELMCNNDVNIWLTTKCRLTKTIIHYITLANYFWLLVEGIYLQMLLVLSGGYEVDKYFPFFMLFGWAFPWIFVMLWMSLNLFNGRECWDGESSEEEAHLWWVIRAPLIVSIAVNFIIFINVIRIVKSKLGANYMKRNDYKFQLAKSTLTLIPLLGIHYLLFLALFKGTNNTDGESKSNNNILFLTELILTSIQGTLIALCYCFLNGEVRCNLTKWWRNHKWKSAIPRSSGPKYSRTHLHRRLNNSQASASLTSSTDLQNNDSTNSSLEKDRRETQNLLAMDQE